MATDKTEYKILVIEDNPGDFALIEDFLFEQIITPQIIQAVTFNAAAKILNAYKFDAILLDLSLPDKKGELLIREIIEMSNDAPVIVLTGFVDFSFGVKSLSMGVADYLLKDDLTSMALYKSVIYCIERKKNITSLLQSEKRYSELFNLSPLPMWVVDLKTLNFLDVNNATIREYGYTREEFLTMTLKDIRPVEEIPNLLIGVNDDLLNPGRISRKLVIHKKKNGELRNVEVEISPIQYGGAGANIVIANDITERVNYTKAIEGQNERLKEISWIQSHIVRAPLSRIMGLIPLLSDLEETGEEREKMLQFILTSAIELDEVIKDITDKSKIEDFVIITSPIKTEK
jgi:PAS domain S-box-containing protein